MSRLFVDNELVVASHNAGKITEIGKLLAEYGVTALAATDFGIPEPEETGVTFLENAVLKAHHAAGLSGLPALADDSGLAVHALGGDPGLYSARWAGPDRDFAKAMEKIEHALKDKDDRRAHFICALALCWPDGHCESFEGRVDGQMVWPPRGNRGFGYDPTFLPDGHGVTFGEMDPDLKHAISHRADAFHQLVAACFSA